MIKKNSVIILSIFAGFMGGMLSNGLFQLPKAHASSNRVVTAEDFQLVNANGAVTGRWTSCDNSPCLNLYDSKRKVRLQVGIYSDGLPFVGLLDSNFEIKALLRLFGSNNAPVLVMKNNNQDRLIMGLNLTDSNEPFLVTFDQDGTKHLKFGQY